MNTQQAYDNWASQYDTNHHKTRNLEGLALVDLNEYSTITTHIKYPGS